MQVALLGFLREQKVGQIQESKLSNLAKEEGVINLKAAREIKAGQVVTPKDVDLDFQKED